MDIPEESHPNSSSDRHGSADLQSLWMEKALVALRAMGCTWHWSSVAQELPLPCIRPDTGVDGLSRQEVRVSAASHRHWTLLPVCLGQGKFLALLSHQIGHYFRGDRAKSLESALPFWRGLSLCWYFSELWKESNENKF